MQLHAALAYRVDVSFRTCIQPRQRCVGENGRSAAAGRGPESCMTFSDYGHNAVIIRGLLHL